MRNFTFLLSFFALVAHAQSVAEEGEVETLPVEAVFEEPLGGDIMSTMFDFFNNAGLMTDNTESPNDGVDIEVEIEEPDFIGDAVASIVDSIFNSGAGLMTDNAEKKGTTTSMSSSTTYYMNSDDAPITVISMSSSDASPLGTGDIDGILDNFFGNFGGLLNNDLGSMLRGPRFGMEEMAVPVQIFDDEMKPSANQEEVTELKQKMQAMEVHIDDLESLRTVSELGFAEATWGVNADQLRKTCLQAFETLCPESVPAVFYQELHQYPPPGVLHSGLAPADPDAPCWMKCVDVHEAQLPFECVENANRMTLWLKAHESEDLVDPNMMLLGAFLHFLVMVLLISTCIRCTFTCLRMRRQRRQSLVEAVKPVQAITIQIPSLEHGLLEHEFDKGEDVMEATVVTGVEVAQK